MCSSALFRSRLPPLKAPLSTGRSWVQFLVMAEWKILFSRKISTFPTLNRDVISFIQVRVVIRYIGIDHLRSPPCPLGGKEGNTPLLLGNTLLYLGKYQFFRLLTESNMCLSALFSSRLPPSKAPLSTGRSWVQFLVMTEWKNPIFSEDFIFSDLRTGCNRVYLGPGRVDPLRRPPCSLGGETGFPHLFHG